jgi:phosphoribosylformimino-5-aminoimidazole carboxamide ribonucleotide (ProFAR) isomerase
MIIPCIDLQGGRAVQLVRGRRRALAVDDVLGLLERFRKYSRLHIIDLDAALRTGRNDRLVLLLCREAKRRFGFRVRVGGGIRTASRAMKLLRGGAEQVILGSAVFKNGRIRERFLSAFARRVGRRRIIIALDCEKGKIVVSGWRLALRLRPEDVIPRLESYCAGFLCTFVDNEGTLRGTNLDWFRGLRNVTSLPIIAAGGIRTRGEVRALERIGMDAAVGMALYLNRLR